MESREVILFGILAVLVLGGFSLVLVYYLQDFRDTFSFTDSLSYSSVTYTVSKNYNDVEVLSSAQASFGKLRLTNEGVFTQVYDFPVIIGCINFADNREAYNGFSVNYLRDARYSGSDRFEVEVGQSVEFEILGSYNSYDIPTSSFSKDNVRSVSLYLVPKDYNSPFGFRDYYSSYGFSCRDFNNLKLLKVVPVV